jgi:hypothetical protein
MRRALRVMLASGFPDARATGSAALPTGVPLLGKPYSADELARTVRALLDDVALAEANA